MPLDLDPLVDAVIAAIERREALLRERLAGIEGELATLPEVRDRLRALERAPEPGPVELELRAALTTLTTTVAELTGKLLAAEVVQANLQGLIEELITAHTSTRERLAVAEVRQLVPGPAGANGKDGRDGLGMDDFEESFDGERTFTRRYVREGKVLREYSWTVPYVLDRGVYRAGIEYAQGDGVTWAGSFWIAQAPTSEKPGDGATAWRLAVKAGRAGRDAA